MKYCKENKNPLIRGGSSQQDRLLPGLQDNYVRIDERNIEHWIEFARNYAAFLKYYNFNNEHQGNWQPFFGTDVSALLSIIAVQDVEDYRLTIKSFFTDLQSRKFETNEGALREKFGFLFSGLLSLAKQIDLFGKKLPDEVLLKNVINNLIQAKLRSSLNRLLIYYSEAREFQPTPGLLIENENPDWKILGETIHTARLVVDEGLSLPWIPANADGSPQFADWNTYKANFTTAANHNYSIYGTTPADITLDQPGELYLRINHAVNHNLFAAVFDEFLKAFAKIRSESLVYLDSTVRQWNTHSPHYALFLAFLRLFKYPQDYINTLTNRHLDFYYREVLRLLPKPPEPNHAHLIFELAKNVSAHLLPGRTVFKAGKDSLNKDVFYQLDDNIVINKSKIAAFKSFFWSGASEEPFNGMLFASPITNSADGKGAEIKSINKEWTPFANKEYIDGIFKKVNMPDATMGFALASHYLFLNEGERKINISFLTDNSGALEQKDFTYFITAPKGWYQIETAQFQSYKEYAIFDLTIPASAPPIVAYSQKVHGETYITDVPLLKIILNNHQGTDPYDDIKEVKIIGISLSVGAGDFSKGFDQTGIKTLLLQNDPGVIDPAKPFLPFGTAPKPGASFVIGNREIFEKQSAEVRFSVEWEGLGDAQKNFSLFNDDKNYPTVTVEFLENGLWKEEGTEEIEFIRGQLVKVDFPKTNISLPNETIVRYDEDYRDYSINSRAGFMRLKLSTEFQYDKYLRDHIEYLIAKANKTWKERDDSGNLIPVPLEPYTPKIRSIYASYVASSSVYVVDTDKKRFDERSIQFFHVYPFGQCEQHAYITGDSSVYLFPQFAHQQTDAKGSPVRKYSVGEFYIGITDLFPPQVVSVLFQVAEGTADPLALKPETHVSWSYLSKNAWIAFRKSDISDQTNQLVQSGIITFSIPDDATNNNTLLPQDFYWIRAAISESPEAVCKLIAVMAQAARVTFYDQGNAPDFLLSPLPSKKIAKLKEPDSAVKTIDQPFSSFGGRGPETDRHFYTRVSERLRHKQRAITIWDYEHLVLEAFPQIHKVKCLNHTQFEPGIEYNEIAPGHVTLITIPDLRQHNAINPLRPYTNRSDLENIKQYIRKYISCHVQLHVENPRFEEVRMELSVRLFPGYDETFYSGKLRQEITSFLTPWAGDENIDISFGGKIYKSSLINFIEERTYVDYITDVKMNHDKQDGSPEVTNLDEITASTAMSILVSAPANKHVITVIREMDQPLEVCSDGNELAQR